tara:strand:+ start:9896 stop:11848 length:1953 start_codon:yes stop_codon:yes gene_type:complete
MNPEFVWWKGKVEDLTDPLELGRVKVRILGYHTDDKSQIPTSDLPFAYPAMPINSRPSDSPIGPTIGTWVLGFFADGKNAQQPIMTHIVDAGYKTSDDPTPPENAPSWGGKRDIPTGEVNVNRLARGEDENTYISDHTPKTGIAVAGKMNKPYSEPSLGSGSYPYNKVEESQSGHVFEVDDTPNNEKITRVHKDGTMEIITGSHRLVKVKGDDYELIVDGKSKHLYAEGNVNVTADGDVNIKGKYIRLEGTQIRIKGNLGVLLESPTGAFVSAPFLSTDPALGGAIMHGSTGQPFVLPAGIPPASVMGPDLPSMTSGGLPSTAALGNLRNAVTNATSSVAGATNAFAETATAVGNMSDAAAGAAGAADAAADKAAEIKSGVTSDVAKSLGAVDGAIGDVTDIETGISDKVKSARDVANEELLGALPTLPPIPELPKLPDFSFPNPLVAMRQAIFASFKMMGGFTMCKDLLKLSWLKFLLKALSLADLLKLMLNQSKESDLDDSSAAMMELMRSSLIDDDNKKSMVAEDSEFDALETLENPITFTDEDGNTSTVSSFEEALKLVVEGKVPSFVEDENVSNIAEFGNVDGTKKSVVDELITGETCVTSTCVTGDATTCVACCVVSTISDSVSSDRLQLGAKPELSDCDDEDC